MAQLSSNYQWRPVISDDITIMTFMQAARIKNDETNDQSKVKAK
jgi:hypothetical protein